MIINKTLTDYRNPLNGSEVTHHVLYAEGDDTFTPLNIVNLFLSTAATSSVDTSSRYSGVIQRFFMWYFFNKKKSLSNFNTVWLSVKNEDIQSWQIYRAVERLKSELLKPSDKTIYSDACIIHDLYVWAHRNNYPVLIKPHSLDYVFDFKNREDDLLAHIPKSKRSRVSKSKIKTKGVYQTNKIRILDKENINQLLKAYADPVYAFMYLLSMCTGLRPEGVTSIPYIGTGKNSHILPWDQMKKTLTKKQKDFEFTVTEKGQKTRTIKINILDWENICTHYLPLCEERRNLYKLKHGEYPSLNYFWFNKFGEPITKTKSISDATTYAKVRGSLNFPCSFYDARHWYATMYILNHLKGNDLWKEDGYNAAVDEYLRCQLGHEDIATTYTFYVSVARLYSAAQGNLISEVATEGGFITDMQVPIK